MQQEARDTITDTIDVIGQEGRTDILTPQKSITFMKLAVTTYI
jgi:hypothetical protein